MSFKSTLAGLAGIGALALVAFNAPGLAAQIAPPGFQSSSPQPNIQPAVADGSEVTQDAPWAVRLTQQNQVCSASLIAPEWVLTARHCVEGAGDALNFNIGSLSDSGGEKASAKQGGVHISNNADLALVNIDHPVQTTYAPLGVRGGVVQGQSVQTYGWGATCTDRPEGECQSPNLKVANVTVNNVACPDLHQGWAICATRGDGLPMGGDSGGPMFSTASDGNAYQVGVSSTSDRQQNTAYTNITEYRGWISSIAGV